MPRACVSAKARRSKINVSPLIIDKRGRRGAVLLLQLLVPVLAGEQRDVDLGSDFHRVVPVKGVVDDVDQDVVPVSVLDMNPVPVFFRIIFEPTVLTLV